MLFISLHQLGRPWNIISPWIPPGECRPGGLHGNYIMFASATSGDRPNNSKFSSCSIANISQVLDAMSISKKRNCFKGRYLSIERRRIFVIIRKNSLSNAYITSFDRWMCKIWFPGWVLNTQKSRDSMHISPYILPFDSRDGQWKRKNREIQCVLRLSL